MKTGLTLREVEMDVQGTIIEDTVVQPGTGWARVVKKGDVLRIVDLEGREAVDFLCYNAADPDERYNAADTIKFNGSIFLSKGTVLYSNLDNPLFTIVEDTCGRHDTLAGACSAESNRFRYGESGSANCRDVFLSVLSEFGLGKRDIVANINFFMHVPVASNGDVAIADGVSKPGDYVDLRAETDVLAVLSVCPQVFNPASGFAPTPARVVVSSDK